MDNSMTVTLDPLDLAALLCSRVCHDVISPVGAIVNGLEVLEDDKDPDTREFALDLIKKSASTASAKLQFCRLAFGAAGSVGASIDSGDAETVTRGLITDDRVKLDWQAARMLMPKNHVKLVLNMCLIAIAAIPRGGVITVSVGEDGTMARVETAGAQIRIAHGIAGLIEGTSESSSLDAHAIQPYYTFLVARASGLTMSLRQEAGRAIIEARPEIAEIAATDPVDADDAPYDDERSASAG